MSAAVISKPTIEINKDLLRELQTINREEGQVIVHCIAKAYQSIGTVFRIQKTTFLFDLNSDHQSELVHAENIAIAPDRSHVGAGKQLHFSLIFSGLPKSCTSFNLIETNETWKPFEVTGIARNKMDVYFVEV